MGQPAALPAALALGVGTPKAGAGWGMESVGHGEGVSNERDPPANAELSQTRALPCARCSLSSPTPPLFLAPSPTLAHAALTAVCRLLSHSASPSPGTLTSLDRYLPLASGPPRTFPPSSRARPSSPLAHAALNAVCRPLSFLDSWSSSGRDRLFSRLRPSCPLPSSCILLATFPCPLSLQRGVHALSSLERSARKEHIGPGPSSPFHSGICRHPREIECCHFAGWNLASPKDRGVRTRLPQGDTPKATRCTRWGPPQRDRPKPKAAYLGAPGYVGTPGTTAANAGPSTGPSTGRTSPTASDGARTRAVSPTRARQDDGAAPPPPMTTPPPVPPPDTPSPPPRRPGRSQKRLPPPPGNPSLPHPPRGAKKGPSQGGVAAPPPPGTTPPARPPRRSETRPPASTSSSAAPSNGAAHGLEGHVPATSPAPRDGAPNGAAAPAGTSGTTANGLASTAAAPGSSTGASGAGSTSGEASGTADGSTGAAANGMGPNGETATGADGAGSNNGGASGGADGTAMRATAASGPTPDGEATRTAGGSPSRVTRKEGETDTKKLKRRGSRNKPSAGLVAGIHRDRIKKAVEEGMNKVTRKKEKVEKSTTKDEVAAAIANMPPEVVKWTSKDGVGNVMCQGTRCRHPSRFLAGKPVLIRHQPSVNVGGRTATHDTYYHWKCTTREQRVRFKAPGSINVSHLLNARDRLEIEWDIANAVKRKNPAPQTTEGNHNKTVAKKRRRRDSIKHEAKKAKRAERAERKAEKGKQRAKAQETDLPSESEDDDDMDGDNANGSDDDKSQSSDSMEASPRQRLGASGGADGTAASGPTPDGEATRTAGGSPSRVTRKEGETDTKKLSGEDQEIAGLVAGIHRDRIKKAVEEGMNKVTRKKEKVEKSTTKDEVAAAIANMPPEVVKWTSKDGVGNVMCQGTRCRHPSRFLAGKPVLIRHQPSVNVGGRTATHDTYYHWKCTTREQRVRFKAPGSINVSHLLNARDRLEIEWDIANAVKRKNPAPQTTEGNHNKTVAKKRRRRDSIKHEAKKAKRAERAERKAEKGKQRAKAQETDLPSESEDDDDMDGDNANGSDDDKSQSSDSMEASPRRSEGSFMEAYRTHDGEGMAAAHSRLQLGLGGHLLGNEANLQGSLSSHSPSAHFQDDRSVRGTPGEDDNDEVQNTVSLGDGEEEQ
ncbi:hypothetical protein B0H21DRAFT_819456 [Amylocystis lapponica]|nr:hypothetical protein B0H21DRAFT_819456 [Amylocystis lapponica]